MANFCKYCGTALKENAKFCSKCGKALGAEVAENKRVDIPKTEEQPRPSAAKKGSAGKKSGKKMILAAVLLICVTAAILGVVYAKLQPEKDEAEPVRKEESREKETDEEAEPEEAEEAEKTEAEEGMYQWLIEPTGELDKVYCLQQNTTDGECDLNLNDMSIQLNAGIWAVEKQGMLGFADTKGRVLLEAGAQRLQVLDGAPAVDSAYNETYYYDGEEYGIYTGGGGVGHCNYYYYCGSLQNALPYGGQGSDKAGTIGVAETDAVYDPAQMNFYKWFEAHKQKYAVYNHGRLVTDFIYEDCGSLSEDGLMAVKKDGKWGYVDQNGEEVIPCSYDASWDAYAVPFGNGAGEREFCYGSSSGYVVLREGGQWLLADVKGNIVIPAGVFEEITPVMKQCCWVKKGGKWGMIQPGNGSTAEIPYMETVQKPQGDHISLQVGGMPQEFRKLNFAVSASSELNEAKYNHSAECLNDFDLSTCWAESAAGAGEGESVRFTSSEPQYIRGVAVLSGYHKSDELFRANGRPARLKISCGGKETECTLQTELKQSVSGEYIYESENWQYIPLSEPIAASECTVEILSAVSGNKYEDTCITEMFLY